MVPSPQHATVDEAFDRIEGTILPCIGLMLDTLLDAADVGPEGASTLACAAELGALGSQLEAFTRQVISLSPANFDARLSRGARTA